MDLIKQRNTIIDGIDERARDFPEAGEGPINGFPFMSNIALFLLKQLVF